jgi:ribosomal protein S6
MQKEDIDVRVYELGYWLVPTISEDEIGNQVTELKNKLKNFGAGEIIAEESAYLREIAYQMCKVINNQNNYFTEGYFGWIKLELDPSKVLALKADLEVDPTIIRFMIIKTVKENTLYTKRPASFKREGALEEETISTEEVTEALKAAEITTTEEVASLVSEKAAVVESKSTEASDLTIIEGLGPKAAEALIAGGIDTFVKLAATKEEVKAILDASTFKVQHLDPTTWGEQAQLAADGKMDELKALQESLNNGKEA